MLGHIFQQVSDLELPNLHALGLTEILDCRSQSPRRQHKNYRASYGKMQERSAGKDTTTGHWEIAGVIIDSAFAVFETFPDKLVRAIVGFEHEPRKECHWNFTRWDLVDLAQFKVKLRAEFQGSNRDMYRPEAIVATSTK